VGITLSLANRVGCIFSRAFRIHFLNLIFILIAQNLPQLYCPPLAHLRANFIRSSQLLSPQPTSFASANFFRQNLMKAQSEDPRASKDLIFQNVTAYRRANFVDSSRIDQPESVPLKS
jgi:hypothetical protein